MPTIVEYSRDQPTRNSYPQKIISPPLPSRCCPGGMVRIGDLRDEGSGKFYYRRCAACGFTVREFMSAFEIERLLSLEVSDLDRMRNWIERIQRRDSSELAA